MIENEIKLPLSQESLLLLIARLKELGAMKEFCVKQVTYRFDTDDHQLQNRGVFLRTRTGEINTMTLKRKIAGAAANIKSREELEINVGGEEDIRTLNKIIAILGFEKCAIMEKYRMQWSFDGCKIAIDELNFGLYVEIEGSQDKIFEVASSLQLDGQQAITGTYWDLFAEYKLRNNIENEDSIKFSDNNHSVLTDFDER